MDKDDACNVGGDNMTFEESLPMAKQLAENQLKKGFDVEAFLILAEINKMDNIDLVPDSEVDEMITDIGRLFITYAQNKNASNLNIMLNSVIRMLGELYYSCTSPQEKELFNTLPDKLNQAFSPTIV